MSTSWSAAACWPGASWPESVHDSVVPLWLQVKSLEVPVAVNPAGSCSVKSTPGHVAPLPSLPTITSCSTLSAGGEAARVRVS